MSKKRVELVLGFSADTTEARRHLNSLKQDLSKISNTKIKVDVNDSAKFAE
jgi:hypothetical protein